jgi:hypothetical protein
METALKNALDALIHDGKALDVPAPEVIEQAPPGSSWQGRKEDGGKWFLVKHGTGSYNSQF